MRLSFTYILSIAVGQEYFAMSTHFQQVLFRVSWVNHSDCQPGNLRQYGYIIWGKSGTENR